MNDMASTENVQQKKPRIPIHQRMINMLDRLIHTRIFSYLYMVSLLLYLLVCGYVLIFAGSLFLEGVARGGYRPGASDYDMISMYLGYLYGFASLCGVIGGLAVISTSPERLYKFKILFFIPSTIWTVQLVLGNFRWGLQYWTQWLYLVPIMALCLFVLFGVAKRAEIPFFTPPKPKHQQVES